MTYKEAFWHEMHCQRARDVSDWFDRMFGEGKIIPNPTVAAGMVEARKLSDYVDAMCAKASAGKVP